METNARDPLAEERRLLAEAQHGSVGRRVRTYARLSGPGFLQSALTLGGGSLGSSLYLGVIAGASMMWVQPLAMLLGIVMLAAIAYVTLSTGERPFRLINRKVTPVLGWAWLLASLAANMVWALPQYALSYSVLSQNLFPETFAGSGSLGGEPGKWIVSLAILLISTIIVWSYGSGSRGVRLYELILKTVVGLIVLCFIAVAVKLFATGQLDIGAILAGFIPRPSQWFEPAPGFAALLEGLAPESRAFWSDYIVMQQRDVMLSAAATAVGINMTFLLPYSMLARSWGREHRGLAIFDLGVGMFIPFLLATSCVILSSAAQAHAAPALDITKPELAPASYQSDYEGLLDNRTQTISDPVTDQDRILAAALVKRDAVSFSDSLSELVGRGVANVVFGLGVVGMTMSTISLLMLISGFVLCEVLDVPSKGWTFRIGSLAAATGALWPLLWSGQAQFWLVVVASLAGGALLPIAYVTFLLLMNSRQVLGDAMPRGGARLVWNSLMAIATLAAISASSYVVYTSSKARLTDVVGFNGGYVGIGLIVLLAIAAVVVRPSKRPAASEI